MAKKKFKRLDIVYSTNPDFDYETEEEEVPETVAPEKQKLIVRMERKGRGGKTVTLVQGFVGSNDDLESLCKQLKNKCGTGGSVKDGEIMVQGDIRKKVADALKKMGYAKARIG